MVERYFSYDSTDLMKEVAEDIYLLGPDEPVYAVYTYYGIVDDYEINQEFITDYWYVNEPKDDITEPWDVEEEQLANTRRLMDHYEMLDSLKDEHVEIMTLEKLYQLLDEQNRII